MPQDRLSPLGVISAAAALIGLVAYSPGVDSLFWSPKAAIVPLLAAAGMVALMRLLHSGLRRAAIAGLLVVAISAVSTVASRDHTVAFFGKYQIGTGLVFVAAIVGAWALGGQLTGTDRRWLRRSLLCGVALNLLVALAEVLVDLSPFQLFRVANRAPGLLGNPVYLSSVMAGAVLAIGVSSRDRDWRWGFACVPLGVGIQLSGGRAGLLVAVAGAVVGVVRARSRAALVVAASFAVGLVVGAALLSNGGGVTSTSRLEAAVAGGGFAPRIDTWLSTRSAVVERPLLGTGPGTFALATSRFRTGRVAKAEGAEQLFADAHNLGVEYLVTTGFLGLGAIAAWVWLASRRASGPYAAFALGILLLHLVEPQYVGTTPVAFLCLGAAGREHAGKWSTWPLRARWSFIVAAVVGAAAGTILVAGDVYLHRAELDFNIDDAVAAERLLPPWPEPASKLSKLYAFRGITTDRDTDFDQALEWQREAVRREPSAPGPLLRLGELELSRGQAAAAQTHFERALAANPQSVRARLGIAQTDLILGRPEEARRELRAASPLATTAQRRVIERLRAQADHPGS